MNGEKFMHSTPSQRVKTTGYFARSNMSRLKCQVPTLFDAPSHPYTEALLKAIPEHSAGAHRLATLPGIVPGRYDRPQGCLLSPRCPYVQPRCRDERPALDAHERGAARCFFPLAPTAEVA